MKVALLGAGSVALANACWIGKGGHEVRLWSALEEERRALAESGSIRYDGIEAGSVEIKAADTAQACIDGADIVMIAAPAFAHDALIKEAAPYITNDQLVVFHPVTGLSSMLMSSALSKRGIKATIADLSTSLFTARRRSPVSVNILKIKDAIDLATIPSSQADVACSLLAQVFGERFRAQTDVLTVSLNNHNPIYHVGPFLCNLGRAEREENSIFWTWITPGVSRLVDILDQERLAVVKRYGTAEVTVQNYFREAHGAQGENLDEIFPSMAERLQGPIGPHGFNHRFILEDVPYGLVFFCSLARNAEVAVPVTESIIQLCSAIWQRDFLREGRTTEQLGLSGLSPKEFMETIKRGFL